MPPNSTFKEIQKLIRKKQGFIIASHKNPEGDAIGSSLALSSIISGLGKKVVVFNEDPIPKEYHFLEGALSVSNSLPERNENEYEVLIILDCSDIKRVTEKDDILNYPTILNIDHHLYNTYFGHLNLVDELASSTGELIYPLLKNLCPRITDRIATQILTAIMVDTGSFRHSNTTPKTFEIAAELVRTGARPDEIARNLYEKQSLNRIRLLTMTLESLVSEDSFAYITLTKDMFLQTHTSPEDIENFIDFPISLTTAKVALLFCERGNGELKVSLRSKGAVNVADIARALGGGGHPNAAGFSIKGNIEDVKRTILGKIQETLGGGNSSDSSNS